MSHYKRPFARGINYPVVRKARPRYAAVYVPDAPAPAAPAPAAPAPAAPAPAAPAPAAGPGEEAQEGTQDQQEAPQIPHTPPPSCADGFPHTVHAGETLDLIAQRFGITLGALLAANPQITDPNLIVPDQLICVPLAPAPACTGGLLYTVQPGDTMSVIAERSGVTLGALTAANPQVTDPNVIFPGQQVCVPSPAQQ